MRATCDTSTLPMSREWEPRTVDSRVVVWLSAVGVVGVRGAFLSREGDFLSLIRDGLNRRRRATVYRWRACPSLTGRMRAPCPVGGTC